jgi:hypothetical protein
MRWLPSPSISLSRLFCLNFSHRSFSVQSWDSGKNPQQMSVVSSKWEAAPTLQAEKNHRFDLPGGPTPGIPSQFLGEMVVSKHKKTIKKPWKLGKLL